MLGDVLSDRGSKMALTRKGVNEAISQYCEIEGYQKGTSKSRISLTNIVKHLMERGEASSEDLLEHFEPVPHTHNPSTGRYGSYHEDQWWADVGRPQLKAFPGVELIDENEGRWQFVGVDPSTFDDEYLVPIEDLRSETTVQIRNGLRDIGVNPRSERHEALVKLCDHLSYTESASTGELDRKLRRMDVSADDIESTLEEIPGVQRHVNGPPDPSEIEVSTMADVIEGYDALDQETIVEWRYTPPNEE